MHLPQRNNVNSAKQRSLAVMLTCTIHSWDVTNKSSEQWLPLVEIYGILPVWFRLSWLPQWLLFQLKNKTHLFSVAIARTCADHNLYLPIHKFILKHPYSHIPADRFVFKVSLQQQISINISLSSVHILPFRDSFLKNPISSASFFPLRPILHVTYSYSLTRIHVAQLTGPYSELPVQFYTLRRLHSSDSIIIVL